MFLQPAIDQDAHDRFNNSVGRYFRWANRRCERLSRTSPEISVSEMYVQIKSLVFMDLALPSRRSVGWEKYSKRIVYESFPTMTKEFFMVEKVEPEQGLARLNNSIKDYNLERWLRFEISLRNFFYSHIPGFERKLIRSIMSSSNNEEKKQYMYRYLRVYDQYRLDLFDERFPLLVFHCTSPPLESELTVHMLKTLCDTDDKKLSALSAIMDVANLETLLSHAREMRFDFWGMWSGKGYLAHQLDFVAAFLELGMFLECAIVLLKFGFPYISDDDAFGMRCFNLLSITFHEEGSIVRTVEPLIEQAHHGHKTRLMLIIDTFTIFCSYHEREVFEDGVRTLVYMTRSLPDPYVTPTELYFTMKPLVVPEFMHSLEAIVNEYSEADIFDDKYDILSPRRLMHLCRVVIRKRLVSNFQLLDGIEDLDIPKKMKSYLKLQNSADECTRLNLNQELYVF